MRKVIVTGASGFLGRNLIKRLGKEDLRIFALSGCPENPVFDGENVTALSREAIRTKEAKEVFSDACVINCAFPRNTDAYDRAEGLRYIKDLFLCCERFGAGAVINISSQSVYPSARTKPAKETDPVSLETVYAAQKYAAELMSECIFERGGIPYSNIRLASLIGPGFDARFVNKMVGSALKEGKIIAGENGARYGFFDVADACEALFVMTGSDKKSWKRVYNLGAKEAVTVTQAAECVRDVLKETDGFCAEICFTDGGNASGKDSSVDASAFYGDFSFEPAVCLSESIRRIRYAY